MPTEITPEVIDDLIADLAAQQVTGSDIFNQYQSWNNPYNAVRRANFHRYLPPMAQRRPDDSLLVLEWLSLPSAYTWCVWVVFKSQS